jgi:hypothetical protein
MPVYVVRTGIGCSVNRFVFSITAIFSAVPDCFAAPWIANAAKTDNVVNRMPKRYPTPFLGGAEDCFLDVDAMMCNAG